MMDNTQVRLFFAILPDDNLKAVFTKLIHSLKKLPICHNIRWINPENLHLTLHFIGNTPEDKIALLIENVQQRITGLSAFSLTINHVASFPPLSRHPHVLAANLKPSIPLLQLVTAIIQGVTDTDLTGDKKPHIPHISIGKFKRSIQLNLNKISQNTRFPELLIQHVALLQSKSTAEGMEYEVIKMFDLR